MTKKKKKSLIVAHNYSFGSYAHKGPTKYFKNESYVDEALFNWKESEFEYKNVLGLIKSIDLSSNNLFGGIPKEITDLLELVSLNLSRNNLTTLIPAMIGQLKSLEALDLFQNQLFGEIPTSPSKISNLSVLDHSNNNYLVKFHKVLNFKASILPRIREILHFVDCLF